MKVRYNKFSNCQLFQKLKYKAYTESDINKLKKNSKNFIKQKFEKSDMNISYTYKVYIKNSSGQVNYSDPQESVG